MIPLIYIILLILMLFILYSAGKHIAKTGKILSPAGIIAILTYTLNEGLRYGRGIDYNLYGMRYEDLAAGRESDWEIGFQSIARFLIANDIPWQGYVMLMSSVFIIATIILLKEYKDVLPYALPLFVLFSMGAVENMVRWYMGFSFIMIGISFLLRGGKRSKLKFWLFTAIACTFHVAIVPLPIAFYLLWYRTKPLLSPIWVIILYFGIALSFQTEVMMRFVELANVMAMMLGGVSERFANYGDDAEYWLTGGFAGSGGRSAFPDKQELLFLLCVVWLGYKAIKDADRKYIYAYNIFVLGLLANPLAKQIELVIRFDQPFMFFRAIVLACIIKHVFVNKTIIVNQMAWLFSLLIMLNIGRKILVTPFKVEQDKYLYVWNSHGKTYKSMYDMWIYDMYWADSGKKEGD